MPRKRKVVTEESLRLPFMRILKKCTDAEKKYLINRLSDPAIDELSSKSNFPHLIHNIST